jgi:hypothetical protein
VSHPRRGIAWPMLGAALLACGVALAQYQVIGGHALDANMRVGDYGVNARSGRFSTPGLARPAYTAQASYHSQPSSARWSRPASATGLTRDRYWTTDLPPVSGGSVAYRPQNGYGYTPPTGIVEHDPLWADLYTPLHATPVIQTSFGGVTTYSTGGISKPLYRPIR